MPQKIVFSADQIEQAPTTLTFSADQIDAPAKTAPSAPSAPSWLDLAGEGISKLVQGVVSPAVILKQMYEDSSAEFDQAVKAGLEGDLGGFASSTLKSTPTYQFGEKVVGGMARSHWDQLLKGKQAYDEGRTSEALGHTMAGLLPVIGPFAGHLGEEIGSGDPMRQAGAVGTALSLYAPTAAARMIPRSVKIPGTGIFKNTNPAEQAAVQYGKQAGIQIDAGTATGSPVVRAGMALGDYSLGGALRGFRQRTAQEQALTRESQNLTAQAHPTAASPETAGASIRARLEGGIKREHAEATRQYDAVRAIEQQQGLVMDVAQTQAALKPLYEELAREASLVPLMGARGRAFAALDRFMRGPNTEAVTVVDKALGGFKELARAQGGVAAKVVQQLEADVAAAVSQGGPSATAARNAGRAATTRKYDIKAVLKELKTEPVQAYKKATANGDAAIEYLRQLKRLAPQEMAKIGRAWLETTFQKATATGKWNRTDGLWSDWQALGPETKQILFPNAAHRTSLDNFFLLQKKMAENVNPSGTALVGSLGAQAGAAVNGIVAINPLTTAQYVFTSNMLARLMRTETGVKALTEVMRIPLTSARNRAQAAAQVSRVAALGGAKPSLVPALAEDRQEP